MLRVLQWERDVSPVQRLAALARRAARPALLLSAMFLMMRFEFMLRASPLAAALLAAGLGAGQSAGALTVGCLLGFLRLPLADSCLLPAISCALVLAAELALSPLSAVRRWTAEFRASLVSGFAVLLPTILFANGDLPASARALSCALLAASSAPFLLSALSLSPGRTHLTLLEFGGMALLACACLAGLYHVLPPLAEISAVLLVLLVPAPGTASGTIAGLALHFGGGGMLMTASLSLCALAGGLKICSLRWQRALMICAAAAASRSASGGGLNPLWALCAAGIYLLLPEGPVGRIRRLFSLSRENDFSTDRIAREISAESRRRLRALGDAFSAMAEHCAAPTDVPDEQELICEMRSRLCAGCAGYENCWAGGDRRAVRLLCDLIADALNRVNAPPGMRVLFSDGEIPPDVMRICRRGRMIPDRLGLLLRDFAQKRRSEIKRCANDQLMSLQFTQAREILYDLAKHQGETLPLGPARLEQLENALHDAGLGSCSVSALSSEPLRLRIRRPSESWTREESQRAKGIISRGLGCRMTPLPREDGLHFIRTPALSADTGASCQSGVAGEICGDSHMVRMLDDSRLLLALSDGMGSGEAAAEESREALFLLHRFLEAGISRCLALETVNQMLLSGSGDEMYATIDLCIIDLNTGIAEMTKLAACRTLILRGGQLLNLEGGHLPLGIVEGVQPGIHRFRLRPGDMLVMGTDGVMESGDALFIEHLVRENALCAPDQLAENLVREAGLRRSSGRRDDMTCICVKMEDAKKLAM